MSACDASAPWRRLSKNTTCGPTAAAIIDPVAPPPRVALHTSRSPAGARKLRDGARIPTPRVVHAHRPVPARAHERIRILSRSKLTLVHHAPHLDVSRRRRLQPAVGPSAFVHPRASRRRHHRHDATVVIRRDVHVIRRVSLTDVDACERATSATASTSDAIVPAAGSACVSASSLSGPGSSYPSFSKAFGAPESSTRSSRDMRARRGRSRVAVARPTCNESASTVVDLRTPAFRHSNTLRWTTTTTHNDVTVRGELERALPQRWTTTTTTTHDRSRRTNGRAPALPQILRQWATHHVGAFVEDADSSEHILSSDAATGTRWARRRDGRFTRARRRGVRAKSVDLSRTGRGRWR